MSGTAVAAAGLLVVVMFVAASIQPYSLRIGQNAAVIAAVLIDLANGDRAEAGLAMLSVSPRLMAVAQQKADDMAARSYFAHVSPDGKDPWYWFEREEYAFVHAGENLAVDFSDSIDVERAWMNSPLHRKNILDPRYTEIGIATAVGTYEGQETVFVVQVFATPVAAAVQPAIVASEVPADPELLATASTGAEPDEVRVLGVERDLADERATASAPSIPTDTPLSMLVSSPKNMLRYSYYILGFFILVALAYTTRFEMKKHHIRHASAAGGLILLMGLLFIAADKFFFTHPVILDAGAATTEAV